MALHVRLIFLKGAIKIGGRPVLFAPIRFEKVTIPVSVQDFLMPVQFTLTAHGQRRHTQCLPTRPGA
jgi:hypothetical protein